MSSDQTTGEQNKNLIGFIIIDKWLNINVELVEKRQSHLGKMEDEFAVEFGFRDGFIEAYYDAKAEELEELKKTIWQEWSITPNETNISISKMWEYFYNIDISHIDIHRVISNLTKEDITPFIKAVLYLWIHEETIEQALYKAKDELQGPHYLINPVIKCFMYIKHPPSDIYHYLYFVKENVKFCLKKNLPANTKNIYEIEPTDFNIMLYTGIKDYSINGVKLK
jgi:hypothetical protein